MARESSIRQSGAISQLLFGHAFEHFWSDEKNHRFYDVRKRLFYPIKNVRVSIQVANYHHDQKANYLPDLVNNNFCRTFKHSCTDGKNHGVFRRQEGPFLFDRGDNFRLGSFYLWTFFEFARTTWEHCARERDRTLPAMPGVSPLKCGPSRDALSLHRRCRSRDAIARRDKPQWSSAPEKGGLGLHVPQTPGKRRAEFTYAVAICHVEVRRWGVSLIKCSHCGRESRYALCDRVGRLHFFI